MGIIAAYMGITFYWPPLFDQIGQKSINFSKFGLVLDIGWGQSDGRITWLVGLDRSFSSDLVPVTSHWDH